MKQGFNRRVVREPDPSTPSSSPSQPPCKRNQREQPQQQQQQPQQPQQQQQQQQQAQRQGADEAEVRQQDDEVMEDHMGGDYEHPEIQTESQFDIGTQRELLQQERNSLAEQQKQLTAMQEIMQQQFQNQQNFALRLIQMQTQLQSQQQTQQQTQHPQDRGACGLM